MKLKQILAIVLSMALVACISVAATVAYLADTDAVVNTFTVGKVEITLDEENVDGDVDPETSATPDRDKQNDYQLFPGKDYDKDPTVHVVATSEECYVYVKVENGIANIESEKAGYVNIATQITQNGWAALEGVENVYWRKHDKVANATADTKPTNYVVFENFTIATDVDNDVLSTYTGDLVKVTAYAIQTETFADEKAAWTASGFGN